MAGYVVIVATNLPEEEASYNLKHCRTWYLQGNNGEIINSGLGTCFMLLKQAGSWANPGGHHFFAWGWGRIHV